MRPYTSWKPYLKIKTKKVFFVLMNKINFSQYSFFLDALKQIQPFTKNANILLISAFPMGIFALFYDRN